MKSLTIITGLFFWLVGMVFGQDSTGISKEPRFTLLTNETPSYAREAAKDTVAERWGIKFERVAGCMILENIADSMKVFNDSVSVLLAARFGSGWQKQFDRDIHKEAKRQSKIIRLTMPKEFE